MPENSSFDFQGRRAGMPSGSLSGRRKELRKGRQDPGSPSGIAYIDIGGMIHGI
jgi:hypothetical protein